ncbi:unnamed protein product [Trichobilharzia regenti]|nr:unnamed protein product [Trichobilharzia regenti]
MKLNCLENYYGNQCYVYCNPEPSRYTCNSDGSYNCTPESECYPDRNPCQTNPCQNGGQCQLSGHYNKSFTCQCTEQWTGHRCTERRSACLEEALKLQYDGNFATGYDVNNTESPPVCLNGGTCYEHATKFEVSCLCLPEWTGDRCELSVEMESWPIV